MHGAMDALSLSLRYGAEILKEMISEYSMERFGTSEKVKLKQDQQQNLSRRIRRICALKKERKRLRAAMRLEESDTGRTAIKQLVAWGNMKALSSLKMVARYEEKRRDAKNTRKNFIEDPCNSEKCV